VSELTVGEGTRVHLNFALQLEDGAEVDSNFDAAPVSFVVGDGSLLPGFETLIFGMCAGQRRLFTVAPEAAFGMPSDANVQRLRRDRFQGADQLEVGLVYSFAEAGGGELPGVIVALQEDHVTVDFNHPLAGRTILFDVLVHRVEPAELH